VVENNIFVGPFPPGLHAWYPQCGDVIARNVIVATRGTNIYESSKADPHFAKTLDDNLFFNFAGQATVAGVKGLESFESWQKAGFDAHSLFADPQFVDAAKGDYRVRPTSPALGLGFKNFPMDSFGVLPKDALEGGKIEIHWNIQLPRKI